MAKKPPYMPGSTLRRPAQEMRRVNPERRARRESEGLVYGPLHKWTSRQPCILFDHPLHVCEFYEGRLIESHHVKSVGSGGQDENNTIPLCPRGHDEFHRLGLVRMCEKWHRDFRSLACEVTMAWQANNGQEADDR